MFVHLVGAGIELGGLQIHEDGAHWSALSGRRLTRLEAIQQLLQIIGPGRALGEPGHPDLRRSRGPVGQL